jgi:cytoskeleton protein RodZ
VTEQTTAEPPDQAVDIHLPGEQLRAERERRHWTQEEVAVKLKLKLHQIDALERDAYERFAAPIFVSGYLRNYARLLELPAEPMLAAFERHRAPAPGLVSDITMDGPRMPTKSTAGQPATLLIAVGAGLIALGTVWWITHDSAEQTPQTPGGDTAITLPELVPTESQSPGSPLPDSSPPGLAMPESVPPGSASPESAPPVPAAPTSTPPIPAAPSPPPATLVLHYQEDSWTAVTDAAGNRLVYRTGKAGETLRVQGPAPFDVVLGNARGVSIEYNGQSFRHPRMNRPDVASFHIAGASD